MSNRVLRSFAGALVTAVALVALHGGAASPGAAPQGEDVAPSCVPAPWCRV